VKKLNKLIVQSPKDGTVAGLRAALERLRAVDDQMTVSIAISFLTVAMFEGRSLREYSELLGLPQSTMSRHLLDLGIMYRDRSPGLGLIDQQQDKDDLRKNIYFLSPKGKALIEVIGQDVRGAGKRFRRDNTKGYSETDLVELNAAWDRLIEGSAGPRQAQLDHQRIGSDQPGQHPR
jgi:DNA-binding MarR family transcriptional regulator